QEGQSGPLQRAPDPVGLPADVTYCETERGGDLTYHGPGQLVVYPIVKLDGSGFGPARDIHTYLRRMEDVFLDELAEGFGLVGEQKLGATGVWVGDQKVASMG